MNILVIDNGSRSLATVLSGLEQHRIEIFPLDQFDFSQPQDLRFDVVLIPGASQYQIQDNDTRFARESAFILSTATPLLGICFGAELIAHANESTLRLLPNRIEGIREIRTTHNHPLFTNRPLLQVAENHRFAITALGKDLRELAHSDTGIEIFEHKTKKQIGFQFHPESLTNTADGHWLHDAAIEYLIKKTP